MNNRKLSTLALELFILITLAGLEIAETRAMEKPEQQITVAVKKLPNGLSINPVRVKRGEPIIWVNHDSEPMKIKILTKVELACSPVNFYADFLGYFESILIGKHVVASICILDKGEYTYEVRRSIKFGDKVNEEVLPGKIIVE